MAWVHNPWSCQKGHTDTDRIIERGTARTAKVPISCRGDGKRFTNEQNNILGGRASLSASYSNPRIYTIFFARSSSSYPPNFVGPSFPIEPSTTLLDDSALTNLLIVIAKFLFCLLFNTPLLQMQSAHVPSTPPRSWRSIGKFEPLGPPSK